MSETTTAAAGKPSQTVTQNHTPGPWVAHQEAHGLFITEAVRGSYCVAQLGDGATDVQQANARLIAAAPDLLLALKSVLPYAETAMIERGMHGDMPDTFIAHARAAIAKAEGRL